MLVQTHQPRLPVLTAGSTPQSQAQTKLAPEASSEPEDGFRPSRRFSSDDVKGALVLGGLGLAGATMPFGAVIGLGSMLSV